MKKSIGFAALLTLVLSTALAGGATDTTLANGRAIFQTGRDLGGARIAAKPPAMFPACANCHGQSGAGGKKLPGGAVSADLRHKAMVTDQKHPYTLTLVERAISTGVDNDGKSLDKIMPRWRLSPRDLHDVAAYVLTLK